MTLNSGQTERRTIKSFALTCKPITVVRHRKSQGARRRSAGAAVALRTTAGTAAAVAAADTAVGTAAVAVVRMLVDYSPVAHNPEAHTPAAHIPAAVEADRQRTALAAVRTSRGTRFAAVRARAERSTVAGPQS